MTREWKKFSNDEIYAVWNSYVRTEFRHHDHLRMETPTFQKEVRLTPMEIVKLVEELMERLDMKDKNETKSPRDS